MPGMFLLMYEAMISNISESFVVTSLVTVNFRRSSALMTLEAGRLALPRPVRIMTPRPPAKIWLSPRAFMDSRRGIFRGNSFFFEL